MAKIDRVDVYLCVAGVEPRGPSSGWYDKRESVLVRLGYADGRTGWGAPVRRPARLVRHAADRPGHPGPLGPAAPGGGVGRGDTGPGDGRAAGADLFAGAAHPIDGTRPTVNIGTIVSGGITPFMHPRP